MTDIICKVYSIFLLMFYYFEIFNHRNIAMIKEGCLN